jgi:hypothetical protein
MVEAASNRIAQRHGCDEYAVPLSRLSEIENKSVIPNIFRLYTLSTIYGMDYAELLSWYGLNLGDVVPDSGVVGAPRRSHPSEALPANVELRIANEVAADFDPRKTTSLGKIAKGLGPLPLLHLTEPGSQSLTYGYVGTEDTTMYPLLRPGSLLQIDRTVDTVSNGPWKSEYDRPIYFVATRSGYCASWCTLLGSNLLLQPHPLSALPVRVMRYPQEADIVGEVVGVAMKIRQMAARA